jgi:hypothetical protein
MEVSNRACARSPTDDSKDASPSIHVDADNVVQDYVEDIFLQHDADAISTSPPLPPPATKPPPLSTTPNESPPLYTTLTTTTTPLPTPTTPPLSLAPPTAVYPSCPASGVQDSAYVDGIPITYDSPSELLHEDACSSCGSEEVCSDVENALPGCLFEMTSSLRRSDSTRKGLKVEFDLRFIGVINVPQYTSDPYRKISISKIMPEIKPIAYTWREVPYPYVSKYHGLNYWKKSWTTRHDARACQEEASLELRFRASQCYHPFS